MAAGDRQLRQRLARRLLGGALDAPLNDPLQDLAAPPGRRGLVVRQVGARMDEVDNIEALAAILLQAMVEAGAARGVVWSPAALARLEALARRAVTTGEGEER